MDPIVHWVSGRIIRKMYCAHRAALRLIAYGSFGLLVFATRVMAGPSTQDAERFTQLAGVNLKGFEFSELIGRFGASPVVHSDNSETPRTRICFRSADGKQVVEFVQGDVDYQFTLRLADKRDANCAVSNALSGDRLEVAGLKLGIGKDVVEKILGQPASATADRLTYQFQYVHTLTDAEVNARLEQARQNGFFDDKPADMRNWNVSIFVSAGFSGNQLSSLLVNRSETN